MLSTRNIYIPYVDGFHDKDKFNFYEKYYKDIGFNVKTLNYKIGDEIDYTSMINDIVKSSSDEIFIVIDYIIVSKFAINLAVELSLEYKCLVKPTNKIYMIDDVDDMNEIVNSMLTESLINSLYYGTENRYQAWPMDGAWVIPSKILDKNIEINKNIISPIGFDFEFCYKNAIFNKIIFLQTDSYKLKPISPNFTYQDLFIYKNYLSSLINLFGTPENVFKYKNMVLEKVDPCKVQDLVFNLDRYFSSPRYM